MAGSKFAVVSGKSERLRFGRVCSSTEWATDFDRLFRRSDSSNQTRKHQLDFANAALDKVVLLGRKETEVTDKQAEIVEFAGRAERHVKKLSQLIAPSSAAAFGDIGRHGKCGPAHLTSQSESFISREWSRRPVHTQSEFMALSPNIKFFEVLHGGPPPRALQHGKLYRSDIRALPAYNLELTTYNSTGSYPQC